MLAWDINQLNGEIILAIILLTFVMGIIFLYVDDEIDRDIPLALRILILLNSFIVLSISIVIEMYVLIYASVGEGILSQLSLVLVIILTIPLGMGWVLFPQVSYKGTQEFLCRLTKKLLGKQGLF